MGRDLETARNSAIELAVAAGRLQLARRGSVEVARAKAHANDLVSEVDVASERLIVDGLARRWPGDGILAEEGTRTAGTTGWCWVIDPLDGTRNYLTGAGPWSVCMALREGGTTRVAVVHDPVAAETFSAVAGAGALLGEEPLAVSSTTRIEESLVGLSFNPAPDTKRWMGERLAGLLPRVGDVRRLPAALDLAFVAAGRLDAGLMVDTQPWDVAAGLLIATEAGAVVEETADAGRACLLATTPALRAGLVRLVSPAS
jgi:myo-inositol-1(or 4)-monophosphatase